MKIASKMQIISIMSVVLLLSTMKAAGNESDPPTLNAISIDKVTIDVSQGEQTILISVDAEDESGINWEAGPNRTNVIFRDSGGGYHYATGSNESPGKLSITVKDTDVGGEWVILWLDLTDIHGNKATFRPLSSFGMPDFITVIGGNESDPPTLNAISIDKVTIDVSQGEQTILISVDAEDESGINWEAGPNRTNVIFRDSGGGYHYATGSNESPGKLSITVKDTDVGGEWVILWLDLTDIHGNKATFRPLSSFGMPDFIYVLQENTLTGDLSLSDQYKPPVSISSQYDYSIILEAQNRDSKATGTLEFSILTENIRINSISRQGSGSLACTVKSVNYRSDGSCSTSSIYPNSSVFFNLEITAGNVGSASVFLSLLDSIPDISLRDNYLNMYFTVGEFADTDGDGVEESIDAFPLNADESVDTDDDGIGNNADTDDDDDGVADSDDAFPLDANESLDTDGDGIGNNADTDDDNDGYTDQHELEMGSDPLDRSDIPSSGGLSPALLRVISQGVIKGDDGG